MLKHYMKARAVPQGTKRRGLRAAIDRGATAVEYGLIIALIAAVIAATVAALGGSLNSLFNNVDKCVQTPKSACGTGTGTGTGG
jgi:pilus assembly protein Flp/PilA